MLNCPSLVLITFCLTSTELQLGPMVSMVLYEEMTLCILITNVVGFPIELLYSHVYLVARPPYWPQSLRQSSESPPPSYCHPARQLSAKLCQLASFVPRHAGGRTCHHRHQRHHDQLTVGTTWWGVEEYSASGCFLPRHCCMEYRSHDSHEVNKENQ